MSGIQITDIQSGSLSWGGEGFGVGDKVSGEVESSERVQATSFDDNTPLFWSDGKPRMISKVVISTDLRDGEDDDGKRTLWLKGGRYEPKEGTGLAGEVALLEAMKAAGLGELQPGCKLQAAITGLAKPTQRGLQSAKLWTMKISPPSNAISTDDLFDE